MSFLREGGYLWSQVPYGGEWICLVLGILRVGMSRCPGVGISRCPGSGYIQEGWVGMSRRVGGVGGGMSGDGYVRGRYVLEV